MKKTITYLDEAKISLGIESDNAMAIYLGITRSAISNYRHGTKVMDDFVAAKIAGALKINEMIVIAAANAEREKTADRREFWKDFYERLGGVAASLLVMFLVSVTFIVTSSPAEAAETQAKSLNTMYIMLNNVRGYKRSNSPFKHYLEIVKVLPLRTMCNCFNTLIPTNGIESFSLPPG